jgi:SAM-dependent MidA family methyltransferase
LLAGRFSQWWRAAGKPRRWRLLECGAYDGSLARDVLQALAAQEPAALESLEYAICEPLPALRTRQAETLAPWAGKLRHATHPETLAAAADPAPGIVFGNELLDALPFRIATVRRGRWIEQLVAPDPAAATRWQWHDGPEIPAGTSPLPPAHLFPEGYRSEWRGDFQAFLEPLTRCLCGGLMLWTDYGFAAPEYYHPDRRTGTLRTFHQHQAGEDPLRDPGSRDITAHVDFTELTRAARALGWQLTHFASQGSWLTGLAREWLLEQERAGHIDPALLRNFHTLTHPAQLGARFHAIEFAWNDPAATPPAPAAEQDRLALDFVW